MTPGLQVRVLPSKDWASRARSQLRSSSARERGEAKLRPMSLRQRLRQTCEGTQLPPRTTSGHAEAAAQVPAGFFFLVRKHTVQNDAHAEHNHMARASQRAANACRPRPPSTRPATRKPKDGREKATTQTAIPVVAPRSSVQHSRPPLRFADFCILLSLRC